MRTSFLQKTMFLAVLVLGLYSCNKDGNDVPKPNEVAEATKTVTLKFSTDPSTYYEDAAMTNKTPTLTSGTIYFVAGTVVVHTATFVAGDVAALKGTGIDYTVPGTVTKVYIVATTPTNALPTLPTAPLGATLASIKTTAMVIAAQTSPTLRVALQGEGDVSGKTVTVDLYPAVARIEIKEITVKPAGAGVNFPLTGFSLYGIFINNTFKELGFDYTTIPTNAAVKYTAATDFQNTGYPTGLFDYNATTPPYLGGASASKKPTTGASPVWAYQVFPAKVEAITGAGKVPQIVLRMGSVTVPALSLTFPGTQFLTITDFLDGSTPITEFEPGKVYTINQIAFAGENLSATPGVPAKIKLKVKVTVKDWVTVITTPDI